MEMMTKMTVNEVIQARGKNREDEFLSELGNGYLWAEIRKQEEFIEELTVALDKIKDKDSFKADYLETWIDSLKIDLANEKKKLN
ncbi:MAG: hypothetical protein JW891_04820 [Candidatus Lokiarchaeota archaeon]|nr:hypothetical protein [Candidatus Lokiarchaeota archaeon]